VPFWYEAADDIRAVQVLVTNLYNHLQPLIRYELGDSFTRQPDSPALAEATPGGTGRNFSSTSSTGQLSVAIVMTGSSGALAPIRPSEVGTCR
jgi:hypothetical protein